MELLIGAAAVFGLLYLLGVEVTTLLNIVQIILTALTFLSALFFVFCDVLLILSEKHRAKLLCIEKQTENEEQEKKDKMLSKFAFYQVGESKLRNCFPAETLMSKKIYENTDCSVRIAKLGKKQLVFDRHSVVIVIAGTVLMGAASALMTAYWLFVFNVIG